MSNQGAGNHPFIIPKISEFKFSVPNFENECRRCKEMAEKLRIWGGGHGISER